MPFGIGEYPAEYNVKIHGPYNPGRYYGPADTAFEKVKLGELPNWLGRRSFNPVNMFRGVNRSYWRWMNKWLHPKRAGGTGVLQFAALYSILMYVTAYPASIKYHKHCKYH